MRTHTDEFLEHFGIPGMKWGRRKSSDGSYSSSGKKAKGERSEDSQAVVNIQKKSVQAMSNAELQKVNTRLQLEKSYNDLNPAVITKGQKFAKNSVGYGKTIKEVVSISKDAADGFKAGKEAYNLAKDLLKDRKKSSSRLAIMP